MKELPSPSLSLTAAGHADATIVPTTLFPQPRRPFAMQMGVFDRDGRLVRESLLWRSYGRMGFPVEDPTPTRGEAREVVFAGHLPQHFGHFILEGLARLWFARQRPDLAVAWACPAGEPAPGYTSWQRQILEVLGIANEPRFITEPTRFARVHVPQSGYRVKDFCAHQQAAFLAAYPARPRDPGLRLWISRSGLPSTYESLHARRLEQELTAQGWTVVQPERLPIREQLELLATAGRVAGEEGSAFHLLALLGDVHGLRVDILCRRPDRPVEEQNLNYQTIADARALDQELHVIPEERVLGVERGHVRKMATTLAGHLEALGVSVPRSTETRPAPRPSSLTAATGPTSPAPAPARPSMTGLVNAVAAALHAETYLELGAGPDRVPDVALPSRDVVRPRFAIDPRRPAPGEQLFEMPQDEFFACCADLDRRYDVIVLDGVNGSHEVAELLVASWRHAGPGTVWLVRGLEGAAMPAAGTSVAVHPSAPAAAALPGGPFPWRLVHAVATDAGTCWLLAAESSQRRVLESLQASGILAAAPAAVR